MRIIQEVLRLDPSNEHAVRAVMRIDHQVGDGAALRRHYAALLERFLQDYDAEPSRDTAELYARLASEKPQRPADPSSAAEDAPAGGPAAAAPASRKRFWLFAVPVIAAVALAIATLFGFVRDAPAQREVSP